MVQKDCVAWLSDVEHRLPSLVIRVRDPDGNDVGEVELWLDDAEQPLTLDGSALVLDPGTRTFRFNRAGFEEQVLEIVVREGEQGRVVDVVLAPLSGSEDQDVAAPAPEERDEVGGSVPASAWVLGGLGVVALGSYAYFGVQAKSERDDLDSCKPGCAQSDVDSAKSKWIASNISFGVAVIAIGAAVWISLDQPSSDRAAKRQLRAGMAPAPGGGVGLLSGSF